MGTIDELFEAVSKLRLRDELPEMIRETGGEIAKKVEAQMQKGQLSTGEKITPKYSNDYYAKIKASMNPMAGFGTPDGKLSGDYYRGMGVAIISDDEYAIESDVPYSHNPSLEQYGDNFTRLSEESKDEYCQETLLPKIQAYVTDITGLTFS